MIKGRITYIGGPLEQLKVAPDLINQAMILTVKFWAEEILPGHFRSGAHAKYDYAARTSRYLKKKAGKPDLVLTGQLQRMATQSRMVRIQKRAKMAVLRVQVPRYVGVYVGNAKEIPVDAASLTRMGSRKQYIGKNRMMPNMPREILATTKDEQRALGEMFAKHLAAAMNAVTTKRVVNF